MSLDLRHTELRLVTLPPSAARMAGPDGRSARANYQTFGRNDADSNEVRQDLEASSLEHADRTRRNLSKQRTLVLIGCSILQLPIWGKQTRIFLRMMNS